MVTIANWVWIRVPWRQSVVDTEDRYVDLISPLSQVALVGGAVLAQEASPVKVYDDLVTSLEPFLGVIKLQRFEIYLQRKRAKQSNLHMCVGIMGLLIYMELYILTLKRQLLWLIQKLLKFLVCQFIILKTLLYVKRGSQHRHKYLLIYYDRVKHDLVCLFDSFVIVLHVEKCNHFLVVMLVRSKPESKLSTALFFCNGIVSSVSCN